VAFGIAKITPERPDFTGTFWRVRASTRRVSGAVTAVLLLAGAFLIGFGFAPASAHAVLEKTSPVDRSTVDTAPGFVTLTFDEPPQTKFSAIHITGPDGQRKDSGPVALNDTAVREQLIGSRPAGRYVVDWRVVSDDGHPISGQFTFTARTAAPTIAVANPSKHDGGGPGKSNATAVVVSVIAGLVIIGGALGLYAVRRHRGNSPALAEGPADE
jgi:copper resistance protein C